MNIEEKLLLLGGVAGLTIATLMRVVAAYSPPMIGPGEDYKLAWSYQQVPPDIPLAWENYFADTNFQNWTAKFNWNLIRLGFYFSDVPFNGSQEQPLSSTDLSLLDEVINICDQNGFKVLLNCFNFTGQQPLADMSTWVTAWSNVATHYEGDSRIYAFEIANELENNQTTTITDLQTCIDTVQSIDSSRWISLWPYSFGFPACPPFSRPRLIIGQHVATYTPTGCQTITNLTNTVNGIINNAAKCGFQASMINEINAQSATCNSGTVLFLQYLRERQMSYVDWGYKAYKSNWDAILAAV